ncbi:aminoglycoside phosphotransferase family protein [Bacillus thuringiensis]|uniref:aminoglycoside phosphotransferase family protein n=1 Tax=Bacillus thuringiensis TaxID=1428 RepID=UPI0011A876BB|nr:phosphotransferase [Bacillus thuringiensis]
MEDYYELIYMASRRYDQFFKELSIEKMLTSQGKHGDKHFKIKLDEKAYSLRLIPYDRYTEEVFSFATDEVLKEQLKYCDYLVNVGIPFMKRIKIDGNNYFTKVSFNGEEWRCCMFEWIEGEHITCNTINTATRIGEVAREMHDLSLKYSSNILPIINHTDAYMKWINDIFKIVNLMTSKKNKDLLLSYLNMAQKHINISNKFKSRPELKVITTDLNSLNVLWNKNEKILGIVDHEHISYSDRIQDLAWLIKWYSRTEGIESHQVSSTLASSLLRGYKANNILMGNDYERLSSLLWLSGCLNYNFVSKTLEILRKCTTSEELDEDLELHLFNYLKRGKDLLGLIK